MSRAPLKRPYLILLGALVLLLAVAPFVPRGGGGDDGTIRTTGRSQAGPGELTAGYGRVSPAARDAIDRVVDSGRTSARLVPGTTSARTIVDDLVRCVSFEGQRYCLGTGWTDQSQAQVRKRTLALVRHPAARRADVTATGDLSSYDALIRTARMSASARARAERAELTQAARSVAKVWILRHEIQGVPLPSGFLARHPEVRPRIGGSTTTTTTVKKRVKGWRDYPRRATVLNHRHVTQQHRTYWCGPTSMQMIAWGWQKTKRSQQHWARRLGTTTSGSAITAMVHIVNRATGYDRASYAGPYITLDIGDWSFKQWKLLMARHIVDYRAPVVLHPVLQTRFYPYLDHDGSGHFQVGRGYEKRPGKTPLLGYFEPWNQQRFHPDEPFIDRDQWRDAYKSYRANEAHFQHNLGV
jgi:hypothetical protein